MKINRPKNTKKKGLVEFFIYKDGNRFVGVCLTFDIIEEGKDPVKLIQSLKKAARLHIETVREKGLSDDLLNRYAPKEYWKKYFDCLEAFRKAQREKMLTQMIQQEYSKNLKLFNKNATREGVACPA